MTCITCKSDKIVSVSAKCSDLCTVICRSTGFEIGPDYVPPDIGIGGGDYIDFNYCVSCGQIQDEFPKEPPREEIEE